MNKIDLISFLQNFYGIYHEDLHFQKLTHSIALELFPQLLPCNNQDADIERIQSGEVIAVYDKTNNIRFYYNPHMILDNLSIPSFCKKEDNRQAKYFDFLDGRSKDELLRIRRQLRKTGQRKEAFMVTKFIRKVKRQEPRDYRVRKLKLIKESGNYD